jgi:hypothetical protein
VLPQMSTLRASRSVLAIAASAGFTGAISGTESHLLGDDGSAARSGGCQGSLQEPFSVPLLDDLISPREQRGVGLACYRSMPLRPRRGDKPLGPSCWALTC